MAEAKKLLIPPAVTSNRELVELFVGRLSMGMGSLVLQHLANSGEKESTRVEKSENSKDPEDRPSRRPEDRFDLEQVWKAAVAVLENYRGIFHWTDKNATKVPVGEREVLTLRAQEPGYQAIDMGMLAHRIEELENARAAEVDKFLDIEKVMETKINEQVESKMKTMLALAHTPEKQQSKQNGSSFKNSPNGFLGKPGSMPKWNRSIENEKCFYCGNKGHFVPNCEELKAEIQIGNIKVHTDGKLRLSDGVTKIPPGPPGMTMKERVEGSQNGGVKSAYYEGFYENEDGVYIPAMAKYSSQYMVTGESAKKRRLRLEQELELRQWHGLG